MTENIQHLRPENLRAELKAADVLAGGDVPRDASDEEITEPLVEHELDGNSRVRAAQERGEWGLASGDRLDAIEILVNRQRVAGGESLISLD